MPKKTKSGYTFAETSDLIHMIAETDGITIHYVEVDGPNKIVKTIGSGARSALILGSCQHAWVGIKG